MKAYKLVRSIGYTRNILNHFSFTLYDLETERIIRIQKPSADEYVQLCGRRVMEWMPWENDDDGIDIIVPMEKWDIDTFK